MHGHEFRGSYTVQVTPFTADGSDIDEAAQRRFVDWQIAEGVPGLIILGTSGEFLAVSDRERTRLIEVTVDQAAGRIPVLVGTMNAHTPTAVRYIKEASMDVGRVFDIVEATEGVMNVFAGERIVESYLLGAVGYVNPFGNYIPGPSSRICDLLAEGKVEEAKAIQRHISVIEHTIAEGHPTWGHQCYSKALAALVGYPMGDVRPPLTSFASLGQEGRDRLEKLRRVMQDLGVLSAEAAE